MFFCTTSEAVNLSVRLIFIFLQVRFMRKDVGNQSWKKPGSVFFWQDNISMQLKFMPGEISSQNVWLFAPEENFLKLVCNTSTTANSMLIQTLV